MTPSARGRARRAALGLGAALVLALALWRVSRTGDHRDARTPSPGAPPSSARLAASPAPSTTPVKARPTIRVVDLAAATPAATPIAPGDAERFPTASWFTEEDQHYPERYFELAERIPELNRAEERRATLAYFVAYRAKLERDLAAAEPDSDRRRAIRAVIDRYDRAIARLRALVATPPS